MNDLFTVLNSAGIRYLLVGGQAMRLHGMPRFSMDWDFFIPPRDEENFKRLNEILKDELDVPLVALANAEKISFKLIKHAGAFYNFILGCRVFRALTKRKKIPSSANPNMARM